MLSYNFGVDGEKNKFQKTNWKRTGRNPPEGPQYKKKLSQDSNRTQLHSRSQLFYDRHSCSVEDIIYSVFHHLLARGINFGMCGI